jgi:flagellar motor protein MotB
MDRANAIRDLLVQGGIDSSRLSTEGYGADKPIASNDTDEGRAKNRRTELVVLKKQ